jgi:ankyrin repeat protein
LEICDIAKQGDTILYGKLKIKKKIFFSLIVAVLFLLAVELLSYALLSLVCLPMPGSMLRDNFSYLTSDPDFGWVPVRGALAHIVKYPQGYDVTIRTGNGFRKDSQDIRGVKDCDVITIGDSHTFGFGLKDEQTLAFQLHSLLSDAQQECLVFNGGVPGYGPSQYYLRLRSLGKLSAGSVVVVYINPINDLTDLSKDIGYGSPKPYASIAGDGIEYVRPILYDPKIHSHFARDFDSLNQALNVTLPTAAPLAARLSRKSQTLQFFQGLRQKKVRFRWNRIEPMENIGPYKEGWEGEERFDRTARGLFFNTSYNIAGQWTEISEFDSERRVAEELLFGVLYDMKKYVESQQAHLLVVVAEECYGKQGFFIRLREILKQQHRRYTFEEGWSRQAVKRAVQKAAIPFLMVEYPVDRIESMFIPYDGHTSAEGFSFIAQKIVNWMEENQHVFLGGKRQEKAFTRSDFDVNVLDGNGYAPLHYAAQNGQKQKVEVLIGQGADVDARDRWDETALYIAVSRGHKNIVELLIDSGADLDIKREANPKGDTPLHSAAETGHNEIIELLITRGAEINTTNKLEQTPIEVAFERKRKDAVALLSKKGASVSTIHLAAYTGEPAQATIFIEEGVSVNAKDSDGRTPLHYATTANVAEFLISKGADVHAEGKRGEAPLHTAAGAGCKEVVELLLDNAANINTRNQSNFTPVHYVFLWSVNTEVLELLIEKGADVHAKDFRGWTYLHYSASGGHKEIAEYLVSKGADINVESLNGKTALSLAKEIGHTEIVELLRKHGAKE